MWRVSREIVLLILVLVLIGCNASSSDIDFNTTYNEIDTIVDEQDELESSLIANKGYYLDSEVKGVNYKCGRFDGITSSDGLFLFEAGEECVFKLGDVIFKIIESDRLFNGVTIIENDVNIARVLMTMDIDANPENGIDIESQATECLGSRLPESESEFDQLVECLNSANIPDFLYRDYAVSEDEAEEHLNSTRESLIPIAKDLDVLTTQNSEVDIYIIAENPRSDELTYKIIQEPTHGRLIGEAPDLIYIPDIDFIGMDSFSYIASNRRFSSNIATVSIEVEP